MMRVPHDENHAIPEPPSQSVSPTGFEKPAPPGLSFATFDLLETDIRLGNQSICGGLAIVILATMEIYLWIAGLFLLVGAILILASRAD
jgi:hypothetical protein